MTPENETRLVELLTKLRRENRQQSGLAPELAPVDPAAAYAIADRAAAALGWEVVGWKIAAFKAEMQAALRTDAPIYGRVFKPFVATSPHTVEHATQSSPIPEAEFVARLGQDLPPREAPYGDAEVAGAIATMHPGIELAECRFIHDDAFPPLPAILADGAGSGGLVIGPAIADWRERDLAAQEVVLSSNGRERRRGSAGASLGHPAAPVVWLANELSRRRIGLYAGQYISTGTLTGMLRPKPGETFVADFGPFGQVEATYR